MQKAYDAMVNMGAEVAANAVFVPAEGGGMMLGPQATMVVNIIGWVYMVYVIVDLLINIIWECEEKEFELGAKRNKAVHVCRKLLCLRSSWLLC